MIDAMIWIGLGVLVAFAIALTWALCIAAEDEEMKRERWSRSMEEYDWRKDETRDEINHDD
jgi:hypothetical protein